MTETKTETQMLTVAYEATAKKKRKPRCDKGRKRGSYKDKIANSAYDTDQIKVRYNELVQAEAQAQNETDEEIHDRIQERFNIMLLMAEATAIGQNRAMIISGPPGLGKSYGIEQVTTEAEAKGFTVERVQGFVRPTGLYRVLHANQHKKSIVVFDDADSVFLDDISLNLLKTACDTTKKRVISWRAEHRMKEGTGENADNLPNSFEFHGSIIFITNLDFDAFIERGHRLKPHLEALISRSHYLDLSLKTRRDYMIRIKQVISEGMLDTLGLDDKDQATVINFIEKNVNKLRELSLRMVLKVATLLTCQRECWEMIAKATCCK